MNKRLFWAIIALVTMASFGFANGAADSESKDQFVVGFSVSDITNPYWATQVKGAQEKADELGVKLVIHDSQMDPTRELSVLENWITQGVDGIMMATLDAEASAPYVERAQAEGIFVVATIHPMKANPDAFLSLDEYKFGYTAGLQAGKWISENLPPDAKFAIIVEDMLAHVIARGDGIVDGVHENAPGAQLVARQSSSNTSEALNIAENLIQAHPDLKVIQGNNDNNALGAYEAFRAAGITGSDVYVGGNDATPQALELISQDTIYRMSVDINPYGSGRLEMEMMWNLLNGIDFEKVQTVPLEAVTKANVAKFLK